MLLLTVEKGSLSAAGRALGVPLPTLSRKISDLETLLGAKMLIRSTRKLTLTDAGDAYVAAARRILEQVEDAGTHRCRRIRHPEGRAGPCRARPVRTSPRPADRQRLPCAFSRDRHSPAALRSQRSSRRRPRRHDRPHRQPAGQHDGGDKNRRDADRGFAPAPPCWRATASRRRRRISPVSPASASRSWRQPRPGVFARLHRAARSTCRSIRACR